MTCPCSILYQRGIYPPENFAPVSKYGLSVLVTSDEGLKTYLVQVLRQLAGGGLFGRRGASREAACYSDTRLIPCRECGTLLTRRMLLYCTCAADWLGKGEVQKLVVVITGVESRDVLERWVFNIETDRAALTPGCVKLMALLCANFKLHARVFIFCLLHCAGWRGSTLTVCLFVATVGFPDAVCSPRKFTPLLRSAVKSTKSHKEIQTEIQVRAGTTDW